MQGTSLWLPRQKVIGYIYTLHFTVSQQLNTEQEETLYSMTWQSCSYSCCSLFQIRTRIPNKLLIKSTSVVFVVVVVVLN